MWYLSFSFWLISVSMIISRSIHVAEVSIISLCLWLSSGPLRDGGAWWASVYGVAQSQTRLKLLSSSSSFLGIDQEEMKSNHVCILRVSLKCSWSEVKWSDVTQSCPTLCDPVDCSLQGSSVHGIFQARVLEWVAISFSRGSSRPRDQTQVSRIAGRCFTVWAIRE